jgi:hypothetical protein
MEKIMPNTAYREQRSFCADGENRAESIMD